ncbi:MAG TPA: uracil-DNA glycosylase [Candidatus Yaniella excrementigallinarum]|nr:uracil-DNA glycosylase [Candidatus Yaniella excrementigallinarum]
MTFSAWPDIHSSWYPVLQPVASDMQQLLDQLHARRSAGEPIEPAPDSVLRVFRMPLTEVKVLLVGQDPYPTPGHAVGLSFSMNPTVHPIARSLSNIFAELHTDIGIPPPLSGDLSAWETQGVFLLNRVLTVTAHQPGSHRNMGWENITAAAVQALAQRGTPLVVLLWGAQARALAPQFNTANILVLESAHPSPLSARRGFFGSKPFSQTNAFLTAHGLAPINWSPQAQLTDSEQPRLFD